MLTPFIYERPETFEEALKLASVCDHRLINGGTDCIIQIRASKKAPRTLISLKSIEEMKEIRLYEDTLYIGAGASLSSIQNHEAVQKACPALAKAVSLVGSPLIRNLATLGGNVGTASPAGDGLTALIGENALAEIYSLQGKRSIPVRELVTGLKKTAVRADEIIKGFSIPLGPKWSFSDFFKIGKRNALAISVVNGTFKLRMDKGVAVDACIVLGAVAPTPIHIHEAERLLINNRITDSVLDELGACVMEHISPIDDIRASGNYRKYMAGAKCVELARRAWEVCGND